MGFKNDLENMSFERAMSSAEGMECVLCWEKQEGRGERWKKDGEEKGGRREE